MGRRGAERRFRLSGTCLICSAFPRAILCSNVRIHGLPESVRYVPYTGLDCFDRYNNGFEGVIFLIDEIHIEFNSLESKNMPVSIITEIAQQRKQRKHIVGTSQVFGRIAKPFREQFKYVVQCKTFFGLMSFNRVSRGEDIETKIDESISCPVYRRYFFFHSPELYQSYDTYAKIQRCESTEKGLVKR